MDQHIKKLMEALAAVTVVVNMIKEDMGSYAYIQRTAKAQEKEVYMASTPGTLVLLFPSLGLPLIVHCTKRDREDSSAYDQAHPTTSPAVTTASVHNEVEVYLSFFQLAEGSLQFAPYMKKSWKLFSLASNAKLGTGIAHIIKEQSSQFMSTALFYVSAGHCRNGAPRTGREIGAWSRPEKSLGQQENQRSNQCPLTTWNCQQATVRWTMDSTTAGPFALTLQEKQHRYSISQTTYQ